MPVSKKGYLFPRCLFPGCLFREDACFHDACSRMPVSREDACFRAALTKKVLVVRVGQVTQVPFVTLVTEYLILYLLNTYTTRY